MKYALIFLTVLLIAACITQCAGNALRTQTQQRTASRVRRLDEALE